MTAEHDLLDERLRRDGAAFRAAGQSWNQDGTDVVRRSHRQQRTARKVTGAAAALAVLVVAGGGLAVGRATKSDDRVIVADSGTSVPAVATTTSAAPATTETSTPPLTSSPPTSSPLTMPPTSSVPTTSVPKGAVPTTVVPTTIAPTTVPTTVAASTPQLRTDGLGIARFGDPEASTMAALAAAFGAPAFDSGWVPAGSTMDGRVNRTVGWGGLFVVFLEGPQGHHFGNWTYREITPGTDAGATPDLSTPEGIRFGTTYAEATAKLGPLTAINAEGGKAYVSTRSEGTLYLTFYLDDPFAVPPPSDAKVGSLHSGDSYL